MPLPRRIAELNRDVTNRVAIRFSGRFPPFALVEHTGRRSGRIYRTPVMLFRAPDGYAIALTYGPSTDWVRNLLAANAATVIQGGHRILITAPRLDHGPSSRRHFPLPARAILRLLNVEDALLVTVAENVLNATNGDP